MRHKAPVVTIDGASGTGKGAVSQVLARRLGWRLLDSGALYRVLALAAQKHGVSFDNEQALQVLAEHLDVQFIATETSAPPHFIRRQINRNHPYRKWVRRSKWQFYRCTYSLIEPSTHSAKPRISHRRTRYGPCFPYSRREDLPHRKPRRTALRLQAVEGAGHSVLATLLRSCASAISVIKSVR